MNEKYDVQKKARAATWATLRAVVSLYLLYMAWLIVKALGDSSPIPPVLGWIIAGVFAAAALGFGVYTWRSYRQDLTDAKLGGPDSPEDEAS